VCVPVDAHVRVTANTVARKRPQLASVMAECRLQHGAPMGTAPTLQASIRNRSRWRWRVQTAALIALIASSATTAGLAIAVARHHAERELVVVERVVPPQPAPPPTPATAPPMDARPSAPVAAATTWADLGPCPAADGPDDRPIGTASPDEGDSRRLDDEPLIGAAVSAARHGALAIWTEDAILFSNDDGRRFDPVLFGPGKVRAAAVDCHGRVFALRVLDDGDAESAPARTMLGVRQGAREGWRSVDFFTEHEDRGPRLAANGGVVAIVGPVAGDINDGLLAVSADGGATWRFDPLEVPGSWEGAAAIDIDPRGVVRVLSRWGDCMSDGSTLTRFDPATGVSTSTAVESYPQGLSALDGGGWVYGSDGSCDGLCGWLGEGAERSLTAWRSARLGDDERTVDVVGDGTTVYALWSGELARLQNGRARWIAGRLPIERAMAVDREGRIIGLTADHDLVRWSRRHGVRYLRGQPPD